MKLLNTIVVVTLTNLVLSGNVQAGETLVSRDNLEVILADNIAANLSEIGPVTVNNSIAKHLQPMSAVSNGQSLLATTEATTAASENTDGIDAE